MTTTQTHTYPLVTLCVHLHVAQPTFWPNLAEVAFAT